MLRTFQASLLATYAMGRGKGTGLNQDDAVTVSLMENDMWTLHLHTYSKLSDPEDLKSTQEFHGDTYAVLKSYAWSTMKMGWCYSLDEEPTQWDCQQVSLNGDPRQGAEVAKPIITDGNYNGTFADFNPNSMKLDTEAVPVNKADGWNLSATKSDSTCEENPDNTIPVTGKFASVKCSKLNTHWLRNFETSQKQQDNQHSMEVAGAEASVFGWAYTTKGDGGDIDSATYKKSDKVYKFVPLTDDFKKLVAGEITDTTPDKDKKPADKGEESDHEGHDHSKDSAAKIAVSAASVVSAIVAFSF